MDKKLQNKLYKKYPSIFQDRKKSMKETCMCWGLEIPDSWYHLLDSLCETIMDIEYNYKNLKVRASQVKEKYATLRFYYNIEGKLKDKSRSADRIHALLDGALWMATHMCSKICFDCGSSLDVTSTKKGWIVYLCKKCHEIEKTKVLDKSKN
jgi:hypothetical protein